MFIIFEGLDKVGKGSIEVAVLKKMNYKPIVMDRGPVGYSIFNDIFKRNEDETYKADYDIINNSGLFRVVYLYCDVKDFYKRINEHNERILYDYESIEKVYRERVIEKHNNPILINTSNLSIEESAELIVKELMNE